MSPLTVIAPAYNEEKNIGPFFLRAASALSDQGIRAEILIIDDGSTDGTETEAKKYKRQRIPIHCIRKPKNEGIAAAWRTGQAAATYGTVCVIDSDLQYQPEEIPRLYRLLMENQVDIVQGARRPPRNPLPVYRQPRLAMSIGWGALLNATFGMELDDNKSGFFVCGREVLEDLLSYKGTYRHWQSFVMVAAHAKGYTIQETPTPFLPRARGRSFIDGRALRTSWECLSDLREAVREYGFRPTPARR